MTRRLASRARGECGSSRARPSPRARPSARGGGETAGAARVPLLDLGRHGAARSASRRRSPPRRNDSLSPTTGLRADPTPERVRAAAPAPRTPAPASASSECPPRSRPCATSRRVRVCAPRRVRRRVRVCAPSAPRRAATGERPFKITQSSCLETRGERARCDPTSYEPSKSPRRPFEKAFWTFRRR